MIVKWNSEREGHLAVIDNAFPGHIREAEAVHVRAALDAMTREERRAIGVLVREHSRACDTDYRGCAPDCEAAEVDAAEREERDDARDAEIARLRELRDAVQKWLDEGHEDPDYGAAAPDDRLAYAYDRFVHAEREATQ